MCVVVWSGEGHQKSSHLSTLRRRIILNRPTEKESAPRDVGHRSTASLHKEKQAGVGYGEPRCGCVSGLVTVGSAPAPTTPLPFARKAVKLDRYGCACVCACVCFDCARERKIVSELLSWCPTQKLYLCRAMHRRLSRILTARWWQGFHTGERRHRRRQSARGRGRKQRAVDRGCAKLCGEG